MEPTPGERYVGTPVRGSISDVPKITAARARRAAVAPLADVLCRLGPRSEVANPSTRPYLLIEPYISILSLSSDLDDGSASGFF